MKNAKPCVYVFALSPQVTQLHPSLEGGFGMYFDRRWLGRFALPSEPRLAAAIREKVFVALEAQIEALGLPSVVFAPGVEQAALRTVFKNPPLSRLKAQGAKQGWEVLEWPSAGNASAEASSTQKPAPKAKATKPAPKAKATKPAPKAKATKPAPKAKATKLAPKAKATKLAPKAKATKLAPKAKATKLAPKAKATKPAPKAKAKGTPKR